jgi:hypothetical protein
METTIYRTIRGSQMEAIFEAQNETINVKYYNAGVSNSEYLTSKKYRFEIKIRHAEDTDANVLFDKEFNKMFPTKVKRMPTKKIFLVSTEVGRQRGRISFYIAEIVPNKGLRLIDNFYTCSATSHRGIESEAVQCLVNNNELPITAINAAHYRDGRVKNYSLIIVEGRGLNYINQIN